MNSVRRACWSHGLCSTLGHVKPSMVTAVLSATEGWARRYERRYIQRWLNSGNATCPASGQVLALPAALTPNLALRKSIEAWAEKYAQWLLVGPGQRLCSYAFVGKESKVPRALAVTLRIWTPYLLMNAFQPIATCMTACCGAGC